MDAKLCRLCANKKELFVGIYDDEGHKLRIETKITKCLQIEMYPEDPLPKMVCLECCSRLEDSYRFLETSHVAQMTLHRLFPITEEVCQTSELKEEDSLVELLPLPAPTDQALTTHHVTISVPEMNVISEEAEEKVDGLEDEIEEEEDDEDEEEEEEDTGGLSQDGLDQVIEEIVEVPNDENEPGSGAKRKRTKTKKVEELTDQEIEELMAQDKQWQQYPWVCSQCAQEMGSVQELREHCEVIHKQPPHYMCTQCSKDHLQFQAFFQHIKRHRSLLKYSCEECGKSFSNKRVLNSHTGCHSKTCNYFIHSELLVLCDSCEECGKSFSNNCEECGKSFSNKRVLDSHTGCHSNTRPYTCQECGKAFRHQNALFIHARCHLPEDIKNKYLCDQCNKRFSTKPNLVTHKRIHTGIRNFTCDQCGKSFIQKGNLDAHMLTHSQDKPFTCQLCSKGFKTAMQLRKHHSVHTGAKPHQCDVCGRSFRERGTLREHLRIHTGAMPFTCEYCGKAFRFKGILTTHRRQHTGERPYSCLECQHHFTNWPNYNKHMKRRHGINTSRQSRAKPPPPVAMPPVPPPPLDPLPLYEEFPTPAYHPHNTFTGAPLQQYFSFTHLDPSLDMMQHR